MTVYDVCISICVPVHAIQFREMHEKKTRHAKSFYEFVNKYGDYEVLGYIYQAELKKLIFAIEQPRIEETKDVYIGLTD